MRKETGKISTHKKVAAGLAVVLIIALLVGGALAWTDFSQSATNRLRGGSDNDVILHDDFESGVNKDVYVENSGNNPLIVRVKFNEYFQVGNTPVVGGNANDKTTWVTHLFDQSGNFTNCDLETHNYFEWVMSGNDKIYKPGTGEIGNYDYTAGQAFQDGSIAKPTLPANAPITMSEYRANKGMYDTEPNGRWILDSDGWAYWSKLLAPGSATNLLLDNVITINNPDDNYFYAIDVILQASNKTEANDMKGKGATSDGSALIDYLAGQSGGSSSSKTVTGIRVKEGTAITGYVEGDFFNKDGLVLIVTYDNGDEKEVTSGFTFEPNGPLSTSNTSVKIKYNGNETVLGITVAPKSSSSATEDDGKLKFKAPYDTTPSYTPSAEDGEDRIWIYDTNSADSGNAFLTPEERMNNFVLWGEWDTTYADKYIKIPLADILADTSKLSSVRLTSTDARFKSSEIFIDGEYNLCSKLVPNYTERANGLVSVVVTLNLEGKSADFTINNMFYGGFMPSLV